MLVRMKRLLLAGLLLAVCGPAWGADRMWFGGGIGMSFGDVDYIALEPVLGFKATPRLSAGVGAIYRYRDDDRYTPSLSSTDYGGNVFARYVVAGPVFAQAEYEWLSYEYRRYDGKDVRDDFRSVLAGPGVSAPIGRRTSFYALALYNFDHNDTRSPYDEAWLVRAGVGVGF